MPHYFSTTGPDGQEHYFEVPDPTKDADLPGAGGPSPDTSVVHKIEVALSSLPKGFLESVNAIGSNVSPLSINNLARLNPKIKPAVGAVEKGQQQSIEGLGPNPTPGNQVEKYLSEIGKGIGSIPSGGPIGPEMSVVRAVANAGLAGAGGQAAADYLKTDNPVVRVAGALAGGGLSGAEQFLLHPQNDAKMVKAALATTPNKEYELGEKGWTGSIPSSAQQQLDRAQKVGIPITTAQAMDNSPGMMTLQNNVAASGQAPKTAALLDRQPAVAYSKVDAATKKLPGTTASPLETANATQKAATEAIAQAREQAGAAYRNVLKGNDPQLDSDQLKPMVDYLNKIITSNRNDNERNMAIDILSKIKNPNFKSVEQAQKEGGVAGLLGPDGKPMLSSEQVKATSQPEYITSGLNLKQSIDDALDSFGQRMLNTQSSSANDLRSAQGIREQLNNIFEKHAPELVNANRAYENVITSKVNPMREGDLGVIAGRTGARDGIPATQRLYSILNRGTDTNAPQSAIMTVGTAMNKTDPQAFASAVKSNLRDRLANAERLNAGAIDSDFAKNFYSDIYGSSAKKKGMKEQLVLLAQGQGLPENSIYPGFDNIMETLGRAGKNSSGVSGVTSQSLSSQAGSNTIGNILRLFGRSAIGKEANNVFSARAYASLDRMLTHPDGVQLLKDLANKDLTSRYSQNLITSYLASQPGQQETQQNAGE